MGDNPDWSLSPYNLFSFSHLGCEVKLRPHPSRCALRGTHITPGTHVVIDSAFHPDSAAYKQTGLREVLGWMQNLPLIGRILAHGTGFYWASLQGVGSGSCEWIE